MFRISMERKRQSKNIDYATIVEIVQEIFKEAKLDVIATERIVSCIRKKIHQLLSIGVKQKKSGGRQYGVFLDRLKASTPYKLKVYVHETDKFKLLKRNEELAMEKQSLEQELKVSRDLMEKLQDDLDNANESAGFWKKRFKSIVRQQIRQTRERKRLKRKGYSEYSERSKYRIKNEIKEECQSALNFLGLFDLVPYQVKFYDPIGEVFDSFSLIDEEEFNHNFLGQDEMDSENSDQLDEINMLLYVKDKFNISNTAWQELSIISGGLPSAYSLKKRIDSLNKHWQISSTPGDSVGVQVKIEDGLKDQAKRLLEENKIEPNETLQIKLSGDGTRIGKRLQLFNFTYSIINEGKCAATEKGNYILAIVRTKDDYRGIRDSLKDIIQEVASLSYVIVADNTLNLEFFLGGDWKFLATVCGIGPANQNFACIWCLCPKSLRHDTSKLWPLNDVPSNGSRTIESIQKDSKGRKNNCQNEPLFACIKMDHVIIDTLHLFLRICDVLIENLIIELRRADAIENRVSRGTVNLTKCPHMERYMHFLNSLNIPFTWSVNRDTGKLQYRDLTGPEKMQVIENINIKELLPSYNDAETVQSVWKKFLLLYTNMRQTFHKHEEIDAFSQSVCTWIQEFLSIYQTIDVTPYMHAFCCHVPQFLRLYGNIEYFNQQGLEKYNDQASKDYFRSTNHRNREALNQLFLKKHRIQFFEARGAERVKGSYCCRNCGEMGHSIKKCTNQCTTCGVAVCLTHLFKVDGKWKKGCK